MAYQRVSEILDRIRALHRQMRDCYERTAADERDERITWLLDYMGRHERQFDAALASFDDTAAEAVLETWFQYVADDNVRHALDDSLFRPGMNADELIRGALRLDAALVGFYESLATSLVAPRVKRLFESLVEMERAKGREYSKRLEELRDQVGDYNARLR